MSDPSSPRVGERVAGRFELMAPLRSNGATRTFLAVDHQTGRDVALSVFDPACAHPGAWAEYVRLVAAASRAAVPGLVLPPNVPATAPNPPYCIDAPQVARGLDRMREQEGPIPWQRALTLGERIAEILDHARAATGVAHRALTPSRCAVTPRDEVKVLDYGAAELEPLDRPDDSGYRAPEQRQTRGDARSDIYSLAAILFELISGQCPPATAPPRLRSLVAVPIAVDQFFVKALAVDPAQRPLDLAAMRNALRELLGLGPLPVSAPPPERGVPKPASRDVAPPAALKSGDGASAASRPTHAPLPPVAPPPAGAPAPPLRNMPAPGSVASSPPRSSPTPARLPPLDAPAEPPASSPMPEDSTLVLKDEVAGDPATERFIYHPPPSPRAPVPTTTGGAVDRPSAPGKGALAAPHRPKRTAAPWRPDHVGAADRPVHVPAADADRTEVLPRLQPREPAAEIERTEVLGQLPPRPAPEVALAEAPGASAQSQESDRTEVWTRLLPDPAAGAGAAPGDVPPDSTLELPQRASERSPASSPVDVPDITLVEFRGPQAEPQRVRPPATGGPTQPAPGAPGAAAGWSSKQTLIAVNLGLIALILLGLLITARR